MNSNSDGRLPSIDYPIVGRRDQIATTAVPREERQTNINIQLNDIPRHLGGAHEVYLPRLEGLNEDEVEEEGIDHKLQAIISKLKKNAEEKHNIEVGSLHLFMTVTLFNLQYIPIIL